MIFGERFQLRNKDFPRFFGGVILAAAVSMQLILVFLTQTRVIINMDGIFSYTLANNPYNYVFIEEAYEEFPKSNGWLDAHILRENYVAEEYDRFNYSAVYHHQRYDVHPPLYYFLVHTVSSLFPGTYSNMYALAINLASLLLIDILVIKLFGGMYGKAGYAAVPLLFLTLLDIMMRLYTWARMYMLLCLFCCWYSYIHWLLVRKGKWKRRYLVQLASCIFLGTLTHYYFYIYGAFLSFFMVIWLIWQRRRYKLLNYLYAGAAGIALSWIFYPWFIWHIFLNQQNKHADITSWSLEKLADYFSFCNRNLFNGRGWIAVLLLAVLALAAFLAKVRKSGIEDKNTERKIFRRMVSGSGILYSLLVFTLDNDVFYYSTAFYMAYIIWISMILLDLAGLVSEYRWNMAAVTLAAVCAVGLCSVSVLKTYVGNAREVSVRMAGHESLRDGFYRVSEDYGQYDCIYIEKEQDSLLHNYWFEFGEYDEFKKIPLDVFLRDGIGREELVGRKSGGGYSCLCPRRMRTGWAALQPAGRRWLVQYL